MKKIIGFLGIISIVGFCYLWVQARIFKNPKEISKEPKEVMEMPAEKRSPKIKVTIVYDNNSFDSRLQTGWGFSCLVETDDKNILFDTGADSPTLLSNIEKLGVDPAQIDLIVLSHIHEDHIGGLPGFLEKNNQVTVYIPSSFPNSFKEEIKSKGANFVDVSGPTKIANGIYSIGEMGTFIREQTLITQTKKGLVIITGCAHPGTVDIVKKAKGLFGKEIYLVLGGFHLGGASDSELREIIKSFRELGVQKAAPCHCSGDRCRELFQEEYEDDYIKAGVGKVIEL